MSKVYEFMWMPSANEGALEFERVLNLPPGSYKLVTQARMAGLTSTDDVTVQIDVEDVDAPSTVVSLALLNGNATAYGDAVLGVSLRTRCVFRASGNLDYDGETFAAEFRAQFIPNELLA